MERDFALISRTKLMNQIYFTTCNLKVRLNYRDASRVQELIVIDTSGRVLAVAAAAIRLADLRMED